MVLDSKGGVLAANEGFPLYIYKLMSFSDQVADRYGLSSEAISNAKDLDSRLDRAIKGLETEVGLK